MEVFDYGDYRKFNSVKQRNHYCSPCPEELTDKFGGAKLISELGMMKGFHQVPIKTADREKYVFVTPLGKFPYQRMPFGLHQTEEIILQTKNFKSQLAGKPGLTESVFHEIIIGEVTPLKSAPYCICMAYLEQVRLNLMS